MHMTGDVNELRNIETAPEASIETPNGDTLVSNGRGQATNLPEINNVHLVPGLKFNLLSAIAATNEGFEVHMVGDTSSHQIQKTRGVHY